MFIIYLDERYMIYMAKLVPLNNGHNIGLD